MGHGYKGDTGHHHSITENLPSLISSYSYHNGYFGKKGQGRDFVRNISSANPVKTAQDFYDKAAHGGPEDKGRRAAPPRADYILQAGFCCNLFKLWLRNLRYTLFCKGKQELQYRFIYRRGDRREGI